MALNKSGKLEIGTVLTWVVIVGVIVYVANFGGFQDTVNGFFNEGSSAQPVNNGNAPVLTDTKDCPTNGKTTFTINVQDALTTTATSRYPEYYVFNGNQLIKEGTLSASASEINLACGKDYKLLLVNTTAATGMYAKVVDLKARISEQTVNEKITLFGGAKILSIENPADPSRSSNISLGASATKGFDIKFSANETQKGYNKPIIMCQANITAITNVNVASFDDGTKPNVVTCPSRVSATTNFKYYCFEYPKMLDPTMGVLTAKASITAGATAPILGDTTACKMVDQATWKTSNYKTATSIEEGFKTGAENTETLAEVGAYDSSVAYLNYTHTGGY